MHVSACGGELKIIAEGKTCRGENPGAGEGLAEEYFHVQVF